MGFFGKIKQGYIKFGKSSLRKGGLKVLSQLQKNVQNYDIIQGPQRYNKSRRRKR